ncbi:MAG: DNA polymerase IV [Candidatus Dormibacteraeota bacterium]|nr:DNA polymerase IV [Candidatus Dormibacteraeota bacterium]
MRIEPTILHLDMDAFYASVEQLQKPSLRGRPVIVGGVGTRGVVATASYEARAFGVHSAMPTGEARRLCPEGVFLAPRFHVYREFSARVMAMLRDLTPVIEPLSLDEAFCDLEAGFKAGLDTESVTALAGNLRSRIFTQLGLTASVGAGTSKLVAKIASDLDKPDGLVVVRPGDEQALLDPLPVRSLWGVGPQTAALLQRHGMTTVRDVAARSREELVRLFGVSRGRALYELARGLDHRPVVAERAVKSVSVEDTFAEDLEDRVRLRAEVEGLVERLSRRLRVAGRAGRTITLKVRRADFSLLARSDTLLAPTDDYGVILDVATRLLQAVDPRGGIRLLGVGVSGLADAVQGELFEARPGDTPPSERTVTETMRMVPVAWPPGSDVAHPRWGQGWVEAHEGEDLRVRFETETTDPGPVRHLRADDPDLRRLVPD